MNLKTFVDTNILVYAHDTSAGTKHEKAKETINQLWTSGTGVLSLQVLQEFHVTLTRKIAKATPLKKSIELIEIYKQWEISPIQATDITKGIEIQKIMGISFWDALIIQAATIADCQRLFSEDFQHGLKTGSLVVENPLKV